jgi:hypothetical protein
VCKIHFEFTKEEIYLTLIQSMRSTEKGKKKKGEKKERKEHTTWPPDLTQVFF